MYCRREPMAFLLGLAVLTTAFVAGCGSKADSEANADFAKSSATNAIGASGSTFIDPLMTSWIENYQRLHPKIQVNYRPIGSGGGIDEFRKRMVEFAASDAPLSDGQLAEIVPTVQIPVVAGPVCVIYNLPQLKGALRLSAHTLAGIYLGRVVTWRDPAIGADNPGVSLPQDPVIVVHRSDGSGTTSIFTNYLSKVSPEWAKQAGAGLTVNWPTGLSGEGSKRVIDLMRQTPGTVAYVELSYATQNNIPVASIQNRSGTFVRPTPSSATAAVEAFSESLLKDPRTPIVDPPASAREAYPISGLTFLLVRKDEPDPTQQQAVKDFISYALTNGQDAAEGLSYARLPAAIQQEGQGLLNQLTGNGQALK